MDGYRFNDEWLQNRLDLFDKFTYPSIEAQTDQKFRWIGIVHKDSPSWFFKELEKYPRMEVHKTEFDIDVAVRGEDSVNLDTDDALSRDFIEEARSIDFEGEILFQRGLRYRILTGNWIGAHAFYGHFNVVKHPEMTVLDFSHGRSKRIETKVIDNRRPMWLEIIHEENIANRMRSASKDKNLGEPYAAQFFEIRP
jgi:hypothetical protein